MLSWANVAELGFVVGLLDEVDEEVTLVFGRENAAARVLESEELPGRESGCGAVKDVRREDGVGVGSCSVIAHERSDNATKRRL